MRLHFRQQQPHLQGLHRDQMHQMVNHRQWIQNVTMAAGNESVLDIKLTLLARPGAAIGALYHHMPNQQTYSVFQHQLYLCTFNLDQYTLPVGPSSTAAALDGIPWTVNLCH